MTRESNLAIRNLPQMEFVDTLHIVDTFDSLNEFVKVDRVWSGLHQDNKALLANWFDGEKDDDGEHKGANWIPNNIWVIF